MPINPKQTALDRELSNTDFHNHLINLHGDRVPPSVEMMLVPAGWRSLVARLFAQLARDFPQARVLSLVRKDGWLRIEHAAGSFDQAKAAKLFMMIQGCVTESTCSCEVCGNGFGRDRTVEGSATGFAGTIRVLCEACFEPEAAFSAD